MCFPLFFVCPPEVTCASEEEEEEKKKKSRRLDGEKNLAVRVASAERARAGIDATARSADRIGRGALDVAFAGGLFGKELWRKKSRRERRRADVPVSEQQRRDRRPPNRDVRVSERRHQRRVDVNVGWTPEKHIVKEKSGCGERRV